MTAHGQAATAHEVGSPESVRRDSVRYDEAYRLWAVAPSG